MTKHVARDTILGHEDEADGIQEYDNPLPDWWLGLLWATILFAVVYGVYYHFIAHDSPQKALAQELADADRRWPAEQAAAAAAPLVLTEEAAEAGEAVFKANCVPCHGADMRGGIGPNLLDDQWIHGGSPAQILTTITDGVAAKGMPPWGQILGAAKVREVAAYVVRQNAKALGRPVPEQEEEEHHEQEREH